MKCHDVQRMISGFIEEKLTDEQLEGFLEHIENCQDCYDELEVYNIIRIIDPACWCNVADALTILSRH